jgi:glycosyltransferase involved in cell wall biosynthesis
MRAVKPGAQEQELVPHPIASVVIPAYNEEPVLGATLSTLLADAAEGELEVVVVANGCHDRTADVAREFGDRVRVVETPVGSKPNALNLGDAAAHHFPRIYLDADIPVTTDTVRRLAQHIADDVALAVSPTMRLDVEGRPRSVRAYYRVWTKLPYVTDAHMAAVFGLSEAGRARFGAFPDVVADDLYVRGQFDPSERLRLDDCDYVVQTPRSLRSLVRVKSRSFAGGAELARRYPEVAARARGRGGVKARFLAMARSPRLWPDLGCYVLVWGTARLRGSWMTRTQRGERWYRDDTTRSSGSGELTGRSPEPPAR